MESVSIKGLILLFFYCIIISATPARENTKQRSATMTDDAEGGKEWAKREQNSNIMKNVSVECYQTRRECDSRCSVSCEELQECDGVRGSWYRCSSNYWLVVILLAVMALFLVVLLVACQCIDKGQGCENVDLYPRILGNHRRSQRSRGINAVQYFTAVSRGRAGGLDPPNRSRKASSSVSHRSDSFSHHRSSLSSQTPLTVLEYNYRYL